MTTILLDSGAVTALANPKRRARIRALLDGTGEPFAVPAAVLSECIRGSARDATANMLLAASQIVDTDELQGRLAGALRSRALVTAAPSGVDALVVAAADRLRGDVVILTSDLADITALAAHARPGLRIVQT